MRGHYETDVKPDTDPVMAFRGEAGMLYVEREGGAGGRYEVWFEDFHIIGFGVTVEAALRDAFKFTDRLALLVAGALEKERA